MRCGARGGGGVRKAKDPSCRLRCRNREDGSPGSFSPRSPGGSLIAAPASVPVRNRVGRLSTLTRITFRLPNRPQPFPGPLVILRLRIIILGEERVVKRVWNNYLFRAHVCNAININRLWVSREGAGGIL